jgi:hypothetical protein
MSDTESDPTNRPLWQVMQGAVDKLLKTPLLVKSKELRAAEIRAIAREIARRDSDDTMSALAVEEWLNAEADRAEAGE